MKHPAALGTMGARQHVTLRGHMRQCAAIWRTARQRRTDARPHVKLRGSTYTMKRSATRGTVGARQHMELPGCMYNCAETQAKTKKRSAARGTMGARPHVERRGAM